MAFQPARFIPPDCYQPEPCALTTRFHLYPPKPWRRRVTPPYKAGYPTLQGGLPHPTPTSAGSYFLRHFLCLPTEVNKLRRLDGAVLCVVRTFLPERRQSGLRFCCKEKESEWFGSILTPFLLFLDDLISKSKLFYDSRPVLSG
jgi:hypothetical protein